MTKETAIKAEQSNKDAQDKAAEAEKVLAANSKPKTITVVFLRDCDCHWLGRKFKEGQIETIGLEDYEKLCKTNHVKVQE